MTQAWIAIAVVAAANAAMKAVGPVTLRARRPSDRTAALTRLLPPALLAALVVYESLGATDGPGLAPDARVAGLGAAAVALALRLPILAVVLAAALATAGARAL